MTRPISEWLPGEDAVPRVGARWDLLTGVFGDPVMSRVFSEQATIGSWLAAERALAAAQARVGVITEDEARAIVEEAHLPAIDRETLWEGTRNVGYPILSLVRQVAAKLPPGPDGRVHFGATTQDIMDTGLALQLAAALDRLSELLQGFGDALCDLVERHAGTVMAARTHAQQAVPTTFGAKLAVLLVECARHRERLAQLRPRVALVSLYGAGGTSASFDGRGAEIRAEMAELLGLGVEHVPWHVARDGVAEFGVSCAFLAATAARFAREVIELSRTEIAEVAEAGGHHRGASSTMPQKRNPISSEVVIGMAGVADGLASGILAAMRPTHERSAGEWQIEWVLVPELAQLAAGALHNAGTAAAGLSVFPEKMEENLHADGGLLLAEAYMMRLAPRLGRERAHDLVYEAAALSRTTGTTLRDATRSLLAEAEGEEAASVMGDLEAKDYVGDVALSCELAIERWRASSDTAPPVGGKQVDGKQTEGKQTDGKQVEGKELGGDGTA